MLASKGPRFQFEIQLPSQESKASFSAVHDEAKRLMTPPANLLVVQMEPPVCIYMYPASVYRVHTPLISLSS